MADAKEKSARSVDPVKQAAPLAAGDTPTTKSTDPAALAAPCYGANDSWYCQPNAFVMNGRSGRGSYYYNNTHYNTTWTLEDCLDVGSRKGWTYKEDGYQFYMFFSRFSSSNGKFELLYSHDTRDFHHYCWAT